MFLKFWMIFAKSLSFVYDEFFHIRNFFCCCFLHPKRVEMKNSFSAISHLDAKRLFIFYTKQFIIWVLKESFHCLFCLSYLQICNFFTSLSHLFTHSPSTFPGFFHNVTNFKFVAWKTQKKKSSKVCRDFYFCQHKKILQIHPENFPAPKMQQNDFFKKARRKAGKLKSVFTFVCGRTKSCVLSCRISRDYWSKLFTVKKI